MPPDAYFDGDTEPWMLQPEERIGPSPAKSIGAVVVGGTVALVAIVGALAMFDDRNWSPSSGAKPQAASTLDLASAPSAPPIAEPAPPIDRLALPAVAAPPAAAVADAPEPPGTDDPTAPPERLPTPPVDRSDPLQVRAASVGLHPELSRVLLGTLTAADFKNAGLAIKTSLAETPDNQDYTYPRQAAADVAVFHIRFVLGAPADCRRYIATVILERWAHTALPMESCGLSRPPLPAAPRKG